jgi:hypothetical protein
MSGREKPCYIRPQLRSSPNVLQRSVELAAISSRSRVLLGRARLLSRSYRPRPTTLEQGIAHRPEETSRAEACLVHSSSPRNRTIKARSCNLQPSNRQQASRLRPGQAAIRRHLLRSKSTASSNDRPKEDRSTSPVRDHGAVEEFR